MTAPTIALEGVRENNLKNIDLKLPRHAVVAVVGVSGSGKSSLLFRAIAAESAARHEAITTTATRKAFVRRPDVDQITGLPYCMTVSQRAIHRSPRSTIATFTGIHDAVRLLIINSGEVYCECGIVPTPTPVILADYLLAEHSGYGVEVGAVLARSRAAGLCDEIDKLRKKGFVSVLVQTEDGESRRERRLEGLKSLNREHRNTLTVLLGLQRVERQSKEAIRSLIERAMAEGSGDVYFRKNGRNTTDFFELDTGITWPCPICHSLCPLPTTSLLSFNSDPSRSGRCSDCDGVGTVQSVEPELLVPDPRLSIDQGCFALIRERGSFKHLSIREDVMRGLFAEHKQKTSLPFASLSRELRNELLYGVGKRRVRPLDIRGGNSGAKVIYHGLIPTLQKVAVTESPAGEYARSYVTSVICKTCDGTRFDRKRVDSYRYRKRPFTEILSETALSARDYFQNTAKNVGVDERRVRSLLCGTLEALVRSGLGYVNLDRSTSTLSGGELQRLKIAGSLCSGMANCCYILDEPSLGLHAIDNLGLIATITELRDLGNTILLADHDPDFRRDADLIIELGPGGGSRGGEVVFVGNNQSRSRLPDELAKIRRLPAKARGASVRVRGCTANNLKGIDIEFPLGGLVCLTGVSGSGKSSFAHQVLFPAVTAFLQGRRKSGPTWNGIQGADQIRSISRVGQQAIGASVTSLVVTYLGIYDRIRDLFAQAEASRARGYTPAHFSFNRPEGRCPVCTGRASVAAGDRSFDRVECPACGGSRFLEAILDVRHFDFSIGDVLNLAIDKAIDVFKAEPELLIPLRLMHEIGLGHLTLGRPTTTLSGGEAQRLKLAFALSQLGGHPEGLVFILDEPTAGLHRSDVQALIGSFDRIIDGGKNTLLVIEHDLDVIGVADHIVDFGPGAGDHGGRVVYSGPPNGAIGVRNSQTGEALRIRSASSTKQTLSSTKGPCYPQGLQTAERFPQGFTERNTRFLQRTRNEDVVDTPEEEKAELLAPTYRLTGGPGQFPLGNRTVSENLRLSELMLKAIGSLAYWSSDENVIWAPDVTKSLGIDSGEYLVAFSPVTALLESRRATRSALSSALLQALERGFTKCVDARGMVLQIRDVLSNGISKTDVFATRIVAGTIEDKSKSSKAVLSQAMEAGGGWVTLYRTNPRGRKGALEIAAELIDRPLNPQSRLVGKRRCVPGTFDYRGAGACPFCGGTGTLPSVDLKLLFDDRSKAPFERAFFQPGCEALLKAISGRSTAALRFLDEEGLASLVDARSRWNTEDWGMLCCGFPWGRFLIKGRSGVKNIDYHEWEGIIPLVLSRLHLSKSRSWASQIESSKSMTSCFSCCGTGFNWLVRGYRMGDLSVAEWLTERTHAELLRFLGENGKPATCRGLLRPLEQLVSFGLGHVRLGDTCDDLQEDDRRRLRSLAVGQLGFAEGTYCIKQSCDGEKVLEFEAKYLRQAASDRRIIVLADVAEES
jgi:excinuclease ABC subunit A